jgi:hypothetical protein
MRHKGGSSGQLQSYLFLSAFIGVHRRPMFVFDDARWAGQKKHIWPVE